MGTIPGCTGWSRSHDLGTVDRPALLAALLGAEAHPLTGALEERLTSRRFAVFLNDHGSNSIEA